MFALKAGTLKRKAEKKAYRAKRMHAKLSGRDVQWRLNLQRYRRDQFDAMNSRSVST